MADNDFAFPTHVDDLEAVPEQWRGLYHASDSQNFTLTVEAAEALRAVEVAADEKLAAAHAERDAKIIAQDASIAAVRLELNDRVTNRAIGDAMLERGAIPGLVPAATKLFRNAYRVDVERLADGTFETAIADSYGRVSIGDAVSTWLAMDEAAPFRQPPPVKDGPLSQALRALRASVH